MPIVISTLACLRGTSAIRCCAGFFMGTVCSSCGGPAHPIYCYQFRCRGANWRFVVNSYPAGYSRVILSCSMGDKPAAQAAVRLNNKTLFFMTVVSNCKGFTSHSSKVQGVACACDRAMESGLQRCQSNSVFVHEAFFFGNVTLDLWRRNILGMGPHTQIFPETAGFPCRGRSAVVDCGGSSGGRAHLVDA